MNSIDKAPGWTDHLNIACRYFRLGMEAAGSENLTQLLDEITPAMKRLPMDTVQRLGAILNESIAAQTRHDYSYLADMLEFKIRPLLEATGELSPEEGERIAE